MVNAPGPSAPISGSLTSLEEHLDILDKFQGQLQAARTLSKAILQPNPLELRKAFEDLQTLAEVVKRPATQEALRVAAESEKNDGSGLDSYQRDTVKVVPPTRDWPLRVRKSLNGPLVLPPRDHPSSQSSERLTLGSLPAFLRDYNRQPEQKASVRLWKESRAAAPPVLRVAIPGILVAYMKLAPVHVGDAALRVMSVTFMGSSESRPPNGSSEYAVFQQATQHFARLLADRNDVSIGLLLDLLSTYDVLFSHGCVLCGTLLSRTRRLPPVGRLWNEDPEEGEVPWQPCHIECIR